MVLAISSIIFVIVISTFSARGRTTADDTARQVVSSIQTVQNEAQKGLGDTTPQGKSLLTGNRIFGELMWFNNSCNAPATSTCVEVFKLMQGPEGSTTENKVSAYEHYTINVPNNLKFYTNYSVPSASQATVCANNFLSCYALPSASTSFLPLNTGFYQLGSSGITQVAIITRVVSGKSYGFGFNPGPKDANSFPTFPPYINDARNYNDSQTGPLWLAMVVPNDTSLTTISFTDANSARYQYLLKMNLSVNGDVQLDVVR